MKKQNSRTKNFLTNILIIAIIVGATLFFFYKKNQGVLQIKSLDESLIVYIDNIKKESSADINQKFDLKKGKHTIIVHKEAHWPWTKDVIIEAGKTTQIVPFFVPQNASGFIINETDPEYNKIKNLFKKDLISPEALEKISSIEIKEAIKALDFYKNREDIVIMALAEGVYALGVDYETEQNLQPIYKGKNPFFIKKDDKSIYILDENNLLEVTY